MNKKSLVIFSALISFVVVANVSAMGNAVPVPRDYRTPPPTPTAGGSAYTFSNEDLAICPVGTISGLDSVVPDPLWLSLCGQCLPSPTVFPTYEFPTQRPQYGGTPVPPVCITPEGGGAETCYTPSAPTSIPSSTPTAFPTATISATSTPSTYCNPAITTATPLASPTPSISTVTIDDASFTNTGSFAIDTNATGAYLTTLTRTVSASSGSTSYTFTGTSFKVYSRTFNNRGIMAVYVDNVFVANVDLYSGLNSETSLVYTSGAYSYSSHVVRFEWTGTKNSSSSSSLVNIDKFTYTTPSISTPIASDILNCGVGSTSCVLDGYNYIKMAFSGDALGAGLANDLPFRILANGTYQMTFKVTRNETRTGTGGVRIREGFSIPRTGKSAYQYDYRDVSGTGSVTDNYYDYRYLTLDFFSDPVSSASFHIGNYIESTGTGVYDLTVEIWLGSTPCDLLTSPTATPGPGGYCSSVNNGISGLENQDIQFWGESSSMSCQVIPSYDTADLFGFVSWVTFILPPAMEIVINAALEYYSVQTPALTICFQPYDFLPIPLFGTVLLFQTFMDIVIGLFIIFHLFNK